LTSTGRTLVVTEEVQHGGSDLRGTGSGLLCPVVGARQALWARV